MIDEESEHGAGNEQELNAERVVLAVVGRLEFNVHQIDSAQRRREIEDFHERVVERNEVGEQVQVASDEHDGEQDLTLARNSFSDDKTYILLICLIN